MFNRYIRWTVVLASAATVFVLGYSVGYWATDTEQSTSMRVLYSQSFRTSASQNNVMLHSTKQIRHARNGDEGGISMHTVFMSGCDKWQVSN